MSIAIELNVCLQYTHRDCSFVNIIKEKRMGAFISTTSLVIRLLLGLFILATGIVHMGSVLFLIGIALAICGIITTMDRKWIPVFIHKKIDQYMLSRSAAMILTLCYSGSSLFGWYIFIYHPADKNEAIAIIACTIIAYTRYPISPFHPRRLSAH